MTEKHKHSFRYAGGAAKCKCGKFLQPDGRITDTPTGRKKQVKNKLKTKRDD